jgi:amino acid transporter
MSEKFLKQPASTGSEDDVEAKAITETNTQVEPQHGGVHIQMIALAGAIVRYPCLRVNEN